MTEGFEKIEYSATEILSFLQMHGKISVEDVETAMRKNDIERVIREQHPYANYQSSDGRWNTYIKDLEHPRKRRRIVKSDYEELKLCLYNLYKFQDKEYIKETKTIADLYPEWLEFKALHTDASSYIVRINYDWIRFYENASIINIPIRKLDKLTLDRWVHTIIREHNLTRKRYCCFSIIIRQLLDYAVDLNIIDYNPFAKVKIDSRLFKPEHKKTGKTQVYMEDEETVFKNYAWNVYYSGLHKEQPLTPLAILFLFQTGLRVGEVCVLKYSDITEDGTAIIVSRMLRHSTREEINHTKGAFGDRYIPLTDEARHIIDIAHKRQVEANVPSDEYIFSFYSRPVGYTTIRNACYKYCNELGIPQKSPHKIRKTVISKLIDSDMNIDAIRRFAGHTDERTTYNSYCYDRRSDDLNRKIINNALM